VALTTLGKYSTVSNLFNIFCINQIPSLATGVLELFNKHCRSLSVTAWGKLITSSIRLHLSLSSVQGLYQSAAYDGLQAIAKVIKSVR
jgi:hypothetical protein